MNQHPNDLVTKTRQAGLVLRNEQVLFSPAGRNIVGASGRVDVVGDRAEVTLLVQLGPRWSFVQSRQPSRRAIPLDASTLTEVFSLVMRD